VLETLLLLVAFQAGQPAQPAPPPPTGLILGRVVDAASSRPVAGAIVALQNVSMIMPGAPAPGPQPRALTNANGQFVFRRLPKGSFGLTVTKPGYVEGAYRRRRPGGGQTSLELADGERNGEVVIPMWRFAAVSGTVTDEAGEPVVGVELRVFERRYLAGKRRLVAGGTQLTDDRGVYRLGTLPPGDYIVAFVSKEVTMPVAAAEILRVGPNAPKYQELSRERMVLGAMSLGLSSGIVIDGMERQVTPGTPLLPQAATRGAAMHVYPTQFFPGTPSAAAAATLTLKSGQERGGVDFTLRPAKTTRVSGNVLGPEGPVANVALRLVPEGDDFATELETSATMSGASGEFTFIGVLPGQYAVKVMRVPRPPTPPMSNVTSVQVGGAMIMTSSAMPGAAPPGIPTEPTLWASVPVGVTDTDVTGPSVVVQSGARLTGRLEFDGLNERPDAQALVRVPVMIERADRNAAPGGTIPPGRVEESGTFKTYGIPGGKYLVRVGSAPPGWTLRSVTSEGRDISDTPLDVGSADVANILITFTDRQTKLTGVVRGAGGNVDPDALVVIFPADSAAWTGFGLNPRRMRSTPTAKAGTYTFGGLPPGEYVIAAVKEENLGSWQYPEMLEALSRIGSQVRLSEGDTRTQDLKTGVVK
jgi:uncharacterized protein (DUF2141 family)